MVWQPQRRWTMGSVSLAPLGLEDSLLIFLNGLGPLTFFFFLIFCCSESSLPGVGFL